MRQGNTAVNVSKHRETTADGRKFDKVKEVGGAAPHVGVGRVQAARKAQHGRLANPADKQWIGTDETPRASNENHTAEHAGPGQCESDGSRQGNTNHTSTEVGGYPQRKK